MFRLKRCTEKDFVKFRESNLRYDPENIDQKLFGTLIGMGVFLAIGYFYIGAYDKEASKSFANLGMAIVFSNVLFFILSIVNNKKYVFKFQKSMISIVAVYWFVFPLIVYIMPLTIAYYDNKDELFKMISFIAAIGCIYLVYVLGKLIYLIGKGKMAKDDEKFYTRLFNGKLRYLEFSIPIIVIVSKSARRLTIYMNNSDNDIGILLLMTFIGFVLQLAFYSIIPEMIMLVYCKLRFKSYHDSYELYTATGNRRKKLIEQTLREIDEADGDITRVEPNSKKKKRYKR